MNANALSGTVLKRIIIGLPLRRPGTANRFRCAGLGFVCAMLAAAAVGGTTNLVLNGDFERPDPDDPRRPLGWEMPDGLGVQWTRLPRPGEADNKRIRMDTRVSEADMERRWRELDLDRWHIPEAGTGPIAATYGLSYYSHGMPVTPGVTYRVRFDVKAPGGGAKLWVRGYGMFRGEMRRRYETVVHIRPPHQDWFEESRTFNPTLHRPEVTEMRVMLYAYWPPGVYAFDNIRIEPLSNRVNP